MDSQPSTSCLLADGQLLGAGLDGPASMNSIAEPAAVGIAARLSVLFKLVFYVSLNLDKFVTSSGLGLGSGASDLETYVERTLVKELQTAKKAGYLNTTK